MLLQIFLPKQAHSHTHYTPTQTDTHKHKESYSPRQPRSEILLQTFTSKGSLSNTNYIHTLTHQHINLKKNPNTPRHIHTHTDTHTNPHTSKVDFARLFAMMKRNEDKSNWLIRTNFRADKFSHIFAQNLDLCEIARKLAHSGCTKISYHEIIEIFSREN